MSVGSVIPASRMASQVRCTTRVMPVSPTNMWCASSVSMKRQVRDSGSKPDCARRVQLHLAVAVGEIGEHEEGQPVRRRLVEGAEHARRVGIARAAAQQIIRFLATVAAKVLLQQVDHRPEMAAFLDIDLEQIAHVVERGRGLAEMALLLDRGRLGVALDHDQAAQHGAIFARDFLPGRLAIMLAEGNDAVLFLRRKQNAPAIVGHAHVVELGPAARIDRNRRCANRPATPGNLPAPCRSTSPCSRDASLQAPSTPGGLRRDSRCSESWSSSRRS